jgi:PHP family Zn ribbon phosphoesterase
MIELNRKCIKCSEEFELKAKEKSSNICGKCKASYQRAYARRKVAELPEDERYKDKYPYDETKKLRRFTEIRQTLDKMKQREEWKAFFKKRLDYLEENEPDILVWIYDRRDHGTMDENRISRVKENYEDTRSIKENEKSWFD